MPRWKRAPPAGGVGGPHRRRRAAAPAPGARPCRCFPGGPAVILVGRRHPGHARPAGLHFAPDPSSQAAATIGGNVAFNSGGAHCLKYGMTANHVLGIKAVREGKQAVAREYFSKAGYTPIGELTSALLSGWSFAAEKNLPGALAELANLKRNQAFENFRLFHAGLMADLTGDRTKAEANYRQAYEKAGTSLRVVQAYGNFLERTGRADEALEAYELFLRATQKNPLVDAARDRLKAGG